MDLASNRPRYALFLIALVLAEVTSAFEVTMIYMALPALVEEFGSPARVGWVITSCLLVSSVAAAICGRLGDMWGRSKILIVVLASCSIGSLVSALSGTLEGVTLGASLQGVAGAILPLCFGVARENLPPRKVPFVIGIVIAAAAIGPGVGYLVAGYIIETYSWHIIFFMSASVALLGALSVLFFVPVSIKRVAARSKIDLLGGILFAPGVAALLFSISQSRSWGFFDARTLGLLAAGLLVLAYWVRYELKHPNPLINVRMLAQRQVILGFLCMACIGLGALQAALITPMILQQPLWTGAGFGIPAFMAGMMLAAFAVTGVIGGPVGGYFSGKHGSRRAVIIGGYMLVVAWGVLVVYRDSAWFVVTLTIIQGLGFSICYAALPNLIVEVIPEERTSEMLGMLQVCRAVFHAIGSLVVLHLVTSSVVYDPQRPEVSFPDTFGFSIGYGWIAALSALCLMIAYILPREPGPYHPSRLARDDQALSQNTPGTGMATGCSTSK